MALILIIDDEIVIRNVVKRVLEGAGHKVLAAEDGKQGVEIFRACQPDLVITDLIMQVQGGLETIAELRRDCPQVKVIAISGGSLSTGDTLADALTAGARRALRKPFSVDALRQTVAELLAEGDASETEVGANRVVLS